MKIVGISLSEVQECLICGKWEISHTLQSKWFKSGSTQIRATIMRFQKCLDSRGPGFRANCEFIHVYMRYDFETVVGLCSLFPIDGPFHGFLNF